jgi:hypothetical protein
MSLQYCTATTDNRSALQKSLAGRIVLQVDQATPSSQEVFGQQRVAVKTQIWSAVSTYFLIAIVKKELQIGA